MSYKELSQKLKPGTICLVAGRPRMGKSDFIFTLEYYCLREDSYCMVSVKHDEYEKSRIERYADAAIRSKNRSDKAVLFHIDYTDPLKEEIPDKESIGETYRALKEIAIKYNSCFLVEIPLSRKVDERFDHTPGVNDILFWDILKSHVDMAIILSSPGYYDRPDDEVDEILEGLENPEDRRPYEELAKKRYSEWADTEGKTAYVYMWNSCGTLLNKYVMNWDANERVIR